MVVTTVISKLGDFTLLRDLRTLQKLTFLGPENRWLEYDRFLLGRLGLFSGARNG